MLEEASDHANQALQEVSEKLHREETMILTGIEPQTQADAMAKDIEKIAKQGTYEEVYLDKGMKVMSGKWVDAERTP